VLFFGVRDVHYSVLNMRTDVDGKRDLQNDTHDQRLARFVVGPDEREKARDHSQFSTVLDHSNNIESRIIGNIPLRPLPCGFLSHFSFQLTGVHLKRNVSGTIR